MSEGELEANGQSGVAVANGGTSSPTHTSKSKIYKVIKINNHSYYIIYDTGADIHLCNIRSAFIPGTLKENNIIIGGIDSHLNDYKDYEMISKESGDIELIIGKQRYVIMDVAYVDERLDDHENDNERNTLLISIRLLSRYNKVGVYFPPGGDKIQFFSANSSKLDEVKIFNEEESYIHRGATMKVSHNKSVIRHSKAKLKRISLSQVSETESEKFCPKFSPEKIMGGNSSESRKNRKDATSSKAKAILKDETTGNQTRKNKILDGNQQKHKSVRKVKHELTRKLHDRIHFGKTQPVIKYLADAYGIPVKSLEELLEEPCDSCNLAKAKFSKPKHQTERPKPTNSGERIVWDIFTSPKRSKDGVKYMLVIVDVYSDYVDIYPLRRKSEASKILIALVKRIERDAKISRPKSFTYIGDTPLVKSLRADGGGENWDKNFLKLTEKLGIETEESLPYSQYQNGVPERVGAIIWENGQALRFAANLPEDDWFRSMRAYVYMKNRLPNAKHPDKTPIELFYNFEAKPLDLIDHFRVFGCLCFINYPKEVRKAKGKLSPKGWKGIFLGYAENATDIKKPKSRGYVVRNVETGEVTRVPRAQVHKFYEHVYPYKDENKDKYKHNHIYNDDMYDDDNKNHSDDDSSDSDDDVTCEPRDDDVDVVTDSDDDDEYVDIIDDDIIYNNISLGKPISAGIQKHTRSHTHKQKNVVIVDDDASDDEVEEKKYGDSIEMDKKHTDDNNDVNDIDYDIEYTLENIIAHKYSKNGGTSYLCQWDSGDVFTYSYEPRSSLKDQDLEAFKIYEDNMKNNKDDTYIISGEMEAKSGAILHEYDHDHNLIKNIYNERGWDHNNNIPSTTSESGGENGASASYDSDINKKINIIRKRIRKIRKIKNKINHTEECENDNQTLSGYARELDDEIFIENQRIKILKSSKHKTKKIIREKGGVVIPDTLRQTKNRTDESRWKEAMDVEWKSFHNKGVIKYVKRKDLPPGSNIVSTRWVYDIKLNSDMETIKRYKARLVARGFTQRYGVDYEEIFAPTMNIKTMRILLALAARDGVEVMQYDVSNAFLHASLDYDVYIEQPEGYDDPRYPRDEYVIKLQRAMYGLKNAGRAWSLHLMDELNKLGFTQNSKDDCLWTLRKGSSYVHYLFHVDDIMDVSNDDKLRNKTFQRLNKVMDIKNEGKLNVFLGMNVERMSDGSYSIDQCKYIEKIAKRFGIDENKKMKKRKTPGDYGSKLTNETLPKTNEQKREALKYDMPALVGALIYCIRTRFDVSYAISDVSRFMAQWGIPHYMHAIRILEYLYQTKDKKIILNKDLLQDKLKLTLYVDANYGDDRDDVMKDVKWKSQGGYMLFLGGALVSWCSRRHHINVLSSMESEYVEASDASKEVLWARQLLNDIGYIQDEPSMIYEDNTACISFTKLGRISERTKHIDIRKYFLKQTYKDKLIDIKHINTDKQLADMMTKYILQGPFMTMRDLCFNGIKNHREYVRSKDDE